MDPGVSSSPSWWAGSSSSTQLAPSAYLASAAGCAHLVRQIWPLRLLNSPFPTATEALVVWQQRTSSMYLWLFSSEGLGWPLGDSSSRSPGEGSSWWVSSILSAGISEEGVGWMATCASNVGYWTPNGWWSASSGSGPPPRGCPVQTPQMSSVRCWSGPLGFGWP